MSENKEICKEAITCSACDEFVDITDPMLKALWKIKELKIDSETLSTIDRAKLYKEHINFACDAFCELYEYNKSIQSKSIEKTNAKMAIEKIVSILSAHNFLPGPPQG